MKRWISSLLLATSSVASLAAPAQLSATPAGNAPASIGAPHEALMRRAGSSSLDLRALPADQPRVPQTLALQPPRVTPVELPGSAQASSIAATAAAAPAPVASFAGLDFASWGDGYPPNANGDVGPTHVLEAVNSSLGIYDKATGTRLAAFTFDAFMSQGNFGNLCDSDNRGSPVVLYDTFEDRWVVSDLAYQTDGSGVVLAPGSFQCIAVSKSGDPLSGGWNFYSINISDGFGADPKLGIWPDGIYLSVNLYDNTLAYFQYPRVFALNKAQMYAGAASAQVVSFDAPAAEFTLLPANARLQAGTPPAGSPNYLAVVWQFRNVLSVYKFHVDWNSISTSTLTGPFLAQSASSWGQLNNGLARAPGTDVQTLHPRLMVQNQYSNLAGTESIWASHTVGAASPTSTQAAVRFYQVNVSGGSVGAVPIQAATFSPDATTHRFMPSLAVDRAGNMALGYSASSQSLNPAIRYAGRLAGDSAGTITQSETSLIEGGGTQSVNCDGSPCMRWGGYSSMSLDPDGCTFWMVNEYYAATGGNWQTRIGAFRYPSCTTPASGSVTGTVTSSLNGAPIPGAIVTFGSRSTSSDGRGVYSFDGLPAGTYPSLGAAAEGYVSAAATDIAVSGGNATVQDFVLAPAPSGVCLSDVSQASLQTGIPTRVDLASSPGNAILAKTVGVDQHADENGLNSGYAFTSTSFLGQTFTAGASGKLTRVDASIFCAINCSGVNPNMILEVRTTSGGLPVMSAGGLLASATIGGSASGAAVPFAFAPTPAPTLTAGVQYGLVLRLASNRTVGNNAWRATNGSNYAGGVRLSCSASACALPTGTNADSDFVFKTYLETGYYASGDLISSLKDSNPAHDSIAGWTTLSWNGATPSGTSLRFQVAAGNSALGPFAYVGPDGTAATFYTGGTGSLSQFNGSRYLRYRAYLETGDSTLTPTLADATVCYANTPGPPADLSISNSDGVSDAVPGTAITYTIIAANAGPNAAGPNAHVIDSFPPALACSWTCGGTNGGSCSASGSGDIFDAVDLPNGASVTYTATCDIDATATGSLVNTASVTGPSGVSDPTGANNSATDIDTLTPQADLSIDNSDGVSVAVPGSSVSYTLTASNAGPSAAPGSNVTDAFPAALTCTWTCAGSGGGTCTTPGSGSIADTVDLPPGGSVVYSVTCAIAANASGSLVNSASVAAASGVTDTNPGNDSKTDTDTLQVQADIAVTLSDQRSFVRVGDSVDYVIEVTNANGPSDAAASVSDVLPPELTAGSWTCVGSGGATCADGSGDTLSDVAVLPVGAKASYLYSALVQVPGNDLITNSASATLQSGNDAVPGNNDAADTDTVVLFRDGFDGPAPLAVAFAMDAAVTASLRIDAGLLAGLGIVPVDVAGGRSADGRLRFGVQLARFGSSLAARVTTIDASGTGTRSAWQRVDARPALLEFAWQPDAARGGDGFLAVAAGAAPLLVDSRFAHDRPATLLIAVDGGVPWLAPIAP